MKNALLKDTFREIKKSFGRFLSIFAIVTLGVSFFAGINAAAPDMRITADTYYDNSNFMDFKLVSTLGFDDKDIDAIRNTENIHGVFPTNTMDVLTTINENELVLKIHALPSSNLANENKDYINRPKLVEGRLPEKSGECVIEKGNIGDLNVKIGTKLKLSSGTNDDISKSLKMDEFTVVGTVRIPDYLTFEKGTSNIGTGKVSSFIMLSKEDIIADYYSEVLVTVKNARDLNSFSKKYEDFILSNKDSLEAIGDNRKEIRYKEILNKANLKLDESKKEYLDNKSKVLKDLKEAEDKINEAKIELINGENDLVKKKNEVYSRLKDGKKKLEDGEAKLNLGQAEYNNNLEEFKTTKKIALDQISASEETLNSSEIQINALESNIIEMKKILDSGNLSVEDSEKLESDIKEGEAKVIYDRANIKAGREEIEKNKQMLIAGDNKLKEAENQLVLSKTQIESEKIKLANIEKETTNEFNKADEKLENGKNDLKSAEEELERGKTEAESRFKEAENKIDEAAIKIKDIKEPKWYVLDRNTNYSFVDYRGSADRISAIAQVFPLFFFLVAALVCLTTMTRMVDEQRVNIGTLKALGYSKWSIASKYILYAAFASIGGSVLGIAIGFTLFPTIIFNAYGILYILPPVILKFNYLYASISTISAVLITTLSAYFACNKDLIEMPSLLMRPKAPKEGKRILLERIPFIWNRFNFSNKVTARNIFRYKKRFFMTVIGIAGCTALLMAGFGIKDSIKTLVEKQFNEVYKYNMTIGFDSDTDLETQNNIIDQTSKNGEISDYTNINSKNVDISFDESKEPATIIVPKDIKEFNNFIDLRARKNNKEIYIQDDGIVLTEKASKLLKVNIGDTIYINKNENEKVPVKITGISTQYLMNYVYMPEDVYKEIFGEKVKYNEIFAKLVDESKENENKVSSEILKEAKVTTVRYTSGIKNSFKDTITSMNYVVLIMIVSAGALAFVVLYNLTNVNISERIREIATIKVLGFYDNEVSAYVYRENFILTFIGTLTGLGLGVLLHRFIMTTAEPANMMFGRNIEFMSFVYATILTFLFASIVNFVMYFKLKKTPMVESLKSVD